jgi:hypothetical protein
LDGLEEQNSAVPYGGIGGKKEMVESDDSEFSLTEALPSRYDEGIQKTEDHAIP